jgi:hypothetical protein
VGDEGLGLRLGIREFRSLVFRREDIAALKVYSSVDGLRVRVRGLRFVHSVN